MQRGNFTKANHPQINKNLVIYRLRWYTIFNFTETSVNPLINFHTMSPEEALIYQEYMLHEEERGCEYSLANLTMWGRQSVAFIHGCVALFSHYQGRSVYPFPVGPGDKVQVIRELLADANDRGIPCRIIGLTEANIRFLQEHFPDMFHFHCNRDSYDYVYDINDLADLKGKKYQKKRNHLNRFLATYPDHALLPLTEENLFLAREVADKWFARREELDPHADFMLEKRALKRGFARFSQLGLEGAVLMLEGRPIAFSMASAINEEVFDVHFEKALEDIDGGYAAINALFSRHLRQAHPSLKFLNREDDLGIEGLRKAKLSYLPHHLLEKCWAYMAEDVYAD